MELKEMTIEQLEERMAAIPVEIDAPEADLDALESEARSIREELETRKAEEAKKAEIRSAVAEGEGAVIETPVVEERKVMDINEIRNSKEYVDAYAEYIKSGDPAECRALISENGSGDVAVPELVYDIVKTAWEKEGIMSRVRKSYIKGNLKVGFEVSAGEATVHAEGVAVSEEDLVLGIVELVPASIKKWISVSDEVLSLRGSAFLEYIYDELAYKIAKKAADTLVAKIVACGTVSTATCPSVPVITISNPLADIALAMGYLSDEASNPVAIMNKQTWAAFKMYAVSASYPVDPFEGLDVVFNNSLLPVDDANSGDTVVIVGDLDHGALANFPDGDEIKFKYDDTTLATSDLVRVIGRQFVGLGVVAPDAFVKIEQG